MCCSCHPDVQQPEFPPPPALAGIELVQPDHEHHGKLKALAAVKRRQLDTQNPTSLQLLLGFPRRHLYCLCKRRLDRYLQQFDLVAKTAQNLRGIVQVDPRKEGELKILSGLRTDDGIHNPKFILCWFLDHRNQLRKGRLQLCFHLLPEVLVDLYELTRNKSLSKQVTEHARLAINLYVNQLAIYRKEIANLYLPVTSPM